jgi:diaminohydroxyphosphoribosylaminopyrimidine deaminase/5-amino-6-(5-phosphoribosylamino)uracil reductase
LFESVLQPFQLRSHFNAAATTGQAGMNEEDWLLLLRLSEDVRRPRAAVPVSAAVRGRLVSARSRLTDPLARTVYLPLIARRLNGPLVVGQIGQSLDGQIATHGGHSHYINGPQALDHLHRLRALVDAVVIGAGTAVLDDPQLTTRRVAGPSPVRVIIDPNRRVSASARVFDSAVPTLVLHAASQGVDHPEVEGIALDAPGGIFPPQAIVAALQARGLSTLLVEGGGTTLSAFLRAGCLHRLHVMAAPLLVGPGRPAFHLPAIDRLDAALRFSMTAYPLGTDVLLDCDLQRRS